MVTSVAPCSRPAFITMLTPKAWWNGGTASTFSSSALAAIRLVCNALDTRLRCVSRTPFG